MSQSGRDFKATYLRLLAGSSLPDRADWWAVGELIDNGYAEGHFRRSMDRASYGQVCDVLTFAPTVQGRLLADDLAAQLYRQSWRYRLVQGTIAVGSFASGWVLGVSTELGKAYVLNLLGL